METILSKPIPNRFDLQFVEDVGPNEAQSFWFPIIDVMLSLSNQLDNAFSRNRISNESVSKAVPTFVGIVASIKNLHKNIYDIFSSHTKLRQDKSFG